MTTTVAKKPAKIFTKENPEVVEKLRVYYVICSLQKYIYENYDVSKYIKHPILSN